MADMKEAGCGIVPRCANCRNRGSCNAGGVDFECAVAYCTKKPKGANAITDSNATCDKHEFRMCLVLVRDGKYLARWAEYAKVPEFTDDLSKALTLHDWRDAFDLVCDWHSEVLKGCKVRHVCGEREPYPFFLANVERFLNIVEDEKKEVA